MKTHPNLCQAENSLLLIVDMQTRLSAAIPSADTALTLTNTSLLAESANTLDIPVFLTEQYPQGLGPTDARLIKQLPESYRRFDKTGFSCCAADGFNQALIDSQRTQIIISGQEAHVCVLQTALELIHRHYRVYVVEDAVCSRKTEHKHYAMQRMQQLGVTIINYESVLFEWLQGSTHPKFKTISGLLR